MDPDDLPAYLIRYEAPTRTGTDVTFAWAGLYSVREHRFVVGLHFRYGAKHARLPRHGGCSYALGEEQEATLTEYALGGRTLSAWLSKAIGRCFDGFPGVDASWSTDSPHARSTLVGAVGIRREP